MKKHLEISVLIVYFNKINEISLVLEAFLKQTIDYKRFELVIIDDGSEISITPKINEYISRGLCITLRKIKYTGNRAQNRKLAVKFSEGKKLVFFDADMIPAPNFLERHISNLTKDENNISLGFRRLLNPFSFKLVTSAVIKNNFDVIETMPCDLDERMPMIYAHKKNNIDLSRAWYISYSHTIGVNKTLYEKISGNDEKFKYGWGVEDIDLSLQLYRDGGRFVFDERIVSYHVFHGNGENKARQYQANLQYFYEKYKSFEPELFMIQHLQDATSMSKLYNLVYSGKHLEEIKIETADIKNSLFVGFSNFDKNILQNGNKLISTNDNFAEFKLIGSHLPYENSVFEQGILSGSYSVFSIEYLYEILKELSRVCKTIKVQNKNSLVDLEVFWKKKTGYTFSAFNKLLKVRVVSTPVSDNRENTILYFELVKALNENGYYASLELTYDEIKDLSKLFSFSKASNNHLEKAYDRNLRLLNEPVYSVIDSLIAGNNKGFRENLIWWGDVPYYGQSSNEFLMNKKCYNHLFIRNDYKNSNTLIPGIFSERINDFLKNSNAAERPKGIVIVDLLLRNLKEIQCLLQLTTSVDSKLRYVPITIVTINSLIDEFKIFKNLELHKPEKILEKHISNIQEYQRVVSGRINQLIESNCRNPNFIHKTTTGMLDEVDEILKNNSVLIDLNKTRTFNPYVLEAAAFGLKVYTTSEIYDEYEYPNIKRIKYETENAIYDFDYLYDVKRILKPEIIYTKRKINMNLLIDSVSKELNKTVNIQKTIKVNEKNSWRNTIRDFNKVLFNNGIH